MSSWKITTKRVEGGGASGETQTQKRRCKMKGNIHGGKQLGNGKKRLTLFISEDVHTKMLECAKEKQLTVSDITRIAVKEYLTREAGEA